MDGRTEGAVASGATGGQGERSPIEPGLTTRREVLVRGTVAGLAVAGVSPAAAWAKHRRSATRRAAHRRHVFATLGTELEYYRSDPSHLEARLLLCKQAGYTTIQTYVPWNVHENTRGTLDFTGQTHPVIVGDHADEYQIETPDQELAAGGYESRVVANTDLIGFIKACTAHGFKVILRPGPFISDEWRNGGLPDWLGAAYPNMFMRGPHGTSLEPGFPFSPPAGTVIGGGPLYYFSGPSYADPDYIREASRWMTAFAQAVKPYLATQGGPVTSMQVDDEICFYYRFGPFEVDYHPAFVARFGQTPPTDWPAQGSPPTALRPALDWQRFKAQQLAVWLATMRDALRHGGADVPITHEEELQLAPPANFHALAQVLDVLHPEFYLDPGAYTVPTIELCAAAVRASQRQQKPVIAAEMSGNDILVRHLLLGEGITGFLGFTYTTGIDEASVAGMRAFDSTLTTAGARLIESERVADTAIIWPTEYLYAPYHSTSYGFERDVRGAIERDIPALALLLVRAGLAFDLLDTDAAQPPDYLRYPTIWLACADVLPRATQLALIAYVRHGGHLICWPAPPTLDENYEPCTLLRDQLYPEPLAASHPEDFQTINVLGTNVLAYRGVRTYTLSNSSTAVAHRGTDPCGYTRASGRGRATLIGTWLAADSVAGRIGDALAVQDLSTGTPADGARSLLGNVWPPAVTAQVNATPPPRAGTPAKAILFDYTNERRGGEVITGGTAAYWDGENVAAFAEINLANTVPVAGSSEPQVTQPPFRPVTPAHLTVARALHGRPPACDPSDLRAQCRLLRDGDGDGDRARGSNAATVSLVNRYDDDLALSVNVRIGRRAHRLPSTGTLKLPAGEALLLPIAYELRPGLVVDYATVQLVATELAHDELQLTVTSFGGGELSLRLPGRCTTATLDGHPIAAAHQSRLVVTAPAGTHELTVRWTGPSAGKRDSHL